ncbi:transcriptional regulator AraC family [Photobacterium aphoticum]|uniref:Transcriptional regulator AraC family n=1 Tax=Photobacterium aphoticum TaxID=754436 RepID=A0A090QVC7_9GAMM|nr:transcriptional regulator AraC family [Photobacterium aphoticum]
MAHQYQTTWFRAGQQQPLRNVRIHSPSLIHILSGSKRLFWQDSTQEVVSSSGLLCEAAASLSFDNVPHQGRFLSRMISFHCQPTEAMLALSQSRPQPETSPIIHIDTALNATLDALFSFDLNTMSEATQTYWVMGLYQQLAELGTLHLLFPQTTLSFSQQLSRYLSHSPDEEHPLEQAATHFAMSRATLIRKLKAEGRQYRDVLAEVRLNHALYLMQQGQTNVAMLAQCCGYQSEGRFSQRFKGKFGVTPSGYLKTLSADV